MDTLRELRSYVLKEPERGARVLALADKYLQMYDKLGDDFRLPRDDIKVKPVIEYFAGDPAGYAAWLRRLRDDLPARSVAADEINTLYRRVEVRALQRERRSRENRGLAKALAAGLVAGDYESKQRYLRKLVLEWSLRRHATLKEHRRRVSGKHLSLDEQAEILQKFWQEIDDEIARGELPAP